MTSEGLGEMFEGDFADTGIDKFSPMSMWGQATLSSMNRQKARTPIDR